MKNLPNAPLLSNSTECYTISCSYIGEDGTVCPGQVEDKGCFCFWHDPNIPKDGPEVRARLEEWARQGKPMEGFELKSVHLEGIRLSSYTGYNLRKSNLFRACLQGASLFNIDLRGAQLLKADFSGANLNNAKMQGADILGTVFDGAKLERVLWGEAAIQEQKAKLARIEGREQAARELYEEAEEVYRNLRRAFDNVGHIKEAGDFFYREMTIRRMLMPRWSFDRCWSKLVDLFCGYGEKPPRVIGFSLFVILSCAVFYFLHGMNGPGGYLGIDGNKGFVDNLLNFCNCFYFSVVTFTTLGYGDITPWGWARPVAAGEAFVGAFTIAMFIVVFGKKMTR